MTIGDSSPGGDRHHGLVQQPETLLDPPLPDQDVALLVHGEGEQVRIAEALADLGGLGARRRTRRRGRRRPRAANTTGSSR